MQREGKPLERTPLKLRREVDQYIPAEHEIDARKGSPVAEIVFAEDHQPAHLLAHFVRAIEAEKESLGQFRWNVRKRRFGIHASARELDCVGCDVGGEDTNWQLIELIAKKLCDEHRKRVGLFA